MLSPLFWWSLRMISMFWFSLCHGGRSTRSLTSSPTWPWVIISTVPLKVVTALLGLYFGSLEGIRLSRTTTARDRGNLWPQLQGRVSMNLLGCTKSHRWESLIFGERHSALPLCLSLSSHQKTKVEAVYAWPRIVSTFQRLPQIVRLFLWLGSRTGMSSQHFETQVPAQGSRHESHS